MQIALVFFVADVVLYNIFIAGCDVALHNILKKPDVLGPGGVEGGGGEDAEDPDGPENDQLHLAFYTLVLLHHFAHLLGSLGTWYQFCKNHAAPLRNTGHFEHRRRSNWWADAGA